MFKALVRAFLLVSFFSVLIEPAWSKVADSSLDKVDSDRDSLFHSIILSDRYDSVGRGFPDRNRGGGSR